MEAIHSEWTVASPYCHTVSGAWVSSQYYASAGLQSAAGALQCLDTALQTNCSSLAPHHVTSEHFPDQAGDLDLCR